MAIRQGKMLFVFGMAVLATFLTAAPAAHAATIAKHWAAVWRCLREWAGGVDFPRRSRRTHSLVTHRGLA
jgi:hypothetical protein